MKSKPILVVENLTKIFNHSHGFFRSSSQLKAVDHVSFQLYPGEILGLLGPNGAGKTTIIQMLLGTLTPTTGKIFYFGLELMKHRSFILQQISQANAYTKLPGSLTVKESLDVFARLYHVPTNERQARINQLMETFGITPLKNRIFQSLSAGQMTRVILVKAFMSHPRIVLLDEPTASLDPDIARETRKFILQQQQENGVSIILTSHNMQEVSEICQRVLVLQKGSIIEEDTPEQLTHHVALTELAIEITHGLEKALSYLNEKTYYYRYENSYLIIQIEEEAIAGVLMHFAQLKILYKRITIRKPTLEDYFIHMSQR